MKHLIRIHNGQSLVYELKILDEVVTNVLKISPETMMSVVRPILCDRKITAAIWEAEMNLIMYGGESDDRKEQRHEAET